MTKLSARLPKFMFVREAWAEMKHVTWPKSKHIAVFTGLVVICVVVFSYFISFVDRGFIFGLSELRVKLNPDSVKIDNTTPNIQATPGVILDSNGNEIQVDKVLSKEELQKNIESSLVTTPVKAQ